MTPERRARLEAIVRDPDLLREAALADGGFFLREAAAADIELDPETLLESRSPACALAILEIPTASPDAKARASLFLDSEAAAGLGLTAPLSPEAALAEVLAGRFPPEGSALGPEAFSVAKASLEALSETDDFRVSRLAAASFLAFSPAQILAIPDSDIAPWVEELLASGAAADPAVSRKALDLLEASASARSRDGRLHPEIFAGWVCHDASSAERFKALVLGSGASSRLAPDIYEKLTVSGLSEAVGNGSLEPFLRKADLLGFSPALSDWADDEVALHREAILASWLAAARSGPGRLRRRTGAPEPAEPVGNILSCARIAASTEAFALVFDPETVAGLLSRGWEYSFRNIESDDRSSTREASRAIAASFCSAVVADPDHLLRVEVSDIVRSFGLCARVDWNQPPGPERAAAFAASALALELWTRDDFPEVHHLPSFLSSWGERDLLPALEDASSRAPSPNLALGLLFAAKASADRSHWNGIPIHKAVALACASARASGFPSDDFQACANHIFGSAAPDHAATLLAEFAQAKGKAETLPFASDTRLASGRNILTAPWTRHPASDAPGRLAPSPALTWRAYADPAFCDELAERVELPADEPLLILALRAQPERAKSLLRSLFPDEASLDGMDSLRASIAALPDADAVVALGGGAAENRAASELAAFLLSDDEGNDAWRRRQALVSRLTVSRQRREFSEALASGNSRLASKFASAFGHDIWRGPFDDYAKALPRGAVQPFCQDPHLRSILESGHSKTRPSGLLPAFDEAEFRTSAETLHEAGFSPSEALAVFLPEVRNRYAKDWLIDRHPESALFDYALMPHPGEDEPYGTPVIRGSYSTDQIQRLFDHLSEGPAGIFCGSGANDRIHDFFSHNFHDSQPASRLREAADASRSRPLLHLLLCNGTTVEPAAAEMFPEIAACYPRYKAQALAAAKLFDAETLAAGIAQALDILDAKTRQLYDPDYDPPCAPGRGDDEKYEFNRKLPPSAIEAALRLCSWDESGPAGNDVYFSGRPRDEALLLLAAVAARSPVYAGCFASDFAGLGAPSRLVGEVLPPMTEALLDDALLPLESMLPEHFRADPTHYSDDRLEETLVAVAVAVVESGDARLAERLQWLLEAPERLALLDYRDRPESLRSDGIHHRDDVLDRAAKLPSVRAVALAAMESARLRGPDLPVPAARRPRGL